MLEQQLHTVMEAMKARFQATKLRTTMKEQAKSTKVKPSQLLADSVASAPLETRVELQKNIESIKRCIRRTRRLALPKDPKTINELTLEGDWTTTGGSDPKPFLIHDSGTESEDRIIVFATEEGLNLLGTSQEWFMDGTFFCVPSLCKTIVCYKSCN